MATDFTKQQLNSVLSALDGTPRNPANKAAALKAIEKGAKALDLSLDDVLQAADGLIDDRMTAEEFLAELKNQGEPETPAKPKTRTGTKQAKMIDLMRRPEGRHGREDRQGHRLATPHRPRRHLRRPQEKARPKGRGNDGGRRSDLSDRRLIARAERRRRRDGAVYRRRRPSANLQGFGLPMS